MSVSRPGRSDDQTKLTNAETAAIAANTRELIVQLSRGNVKPAHALAQRVQADLKTILKSDVQEASALRRQAQQTMFAVEEVLSLVDQSDLRGAWEAARDAAKEWRAFTEIQK